MAGEMDFGFGKGGADQIGFFGEPAGRTAGDDVLLEQYERRSATRGGTSHRHAGVSAEADDSVNPFLFQETPRGEVSGQILDDKRNRFAGFARQGTAGQREILEARRRDVFLLEGFSAAGESDPQIGDFFGQTIGDGEAGE